VHLIKRLPLVTSAEGDRPPRDLRFGIAEIERLAQDCEPGDAVKL
jgi:hypothetical protein